MHRPETTRWVLACLLVWSSAVRAETPAAPPDAAPPPAPAEPAPAQPPAEPPPAAAPTPPPAETQSPAAPAGEAAVTVEAPKAEQPPAAAPVPVPSRAAQGDYNVKLRDIEERVNQLKEKIFQSKARLIQLQEVVLHGTITGAKAVLVHKNEMGSSFRLTRVQYALDGAPIFNRADAGEGELELQEEFEIFSGSVAPGNHQIAVYLEYQGHGYGVFSYLKGYKFKVKSSYTFSAEEGKLTTIRIVGFEKGGLTTELKDRPSVRYDVETAKELRTETAAGDTPKPAESAPKP